MQPPLEENLKPSSCPLLPYEVRNIKRGVLGKAVSCAKRPDLRLRNAGLLSASTLTPHVQPALQALGDGVSVLLFLSLVGGSAVGGGRAKQCDGMRLWVVPYLGLLLPTYSSLWPSSLHLQVHLCALVRLPRECRC